MTKINLPVSELKNALAGLGKIIGKRTTLPVLGAVYINRDQDGWTTLTSTDLDSFATVRLEQPDNGAPGTVLVPFNDLVKVVKGCSAADTITVEGASKDQAVLRYPIGNQTGEQHTGSFPPEEFPLIPRIEGSPVAVQDEVRRAIQEAMQCASGDETRAILQGAFIDVTNRGGHYVVATDGRHLYSSNSFNLPLKDSVLIPDHKFLGWKEFNNDGEWRLQVRPSPKKEKGEMEQPSLLQISSRRWCFITRQFDGNYPNWRQVVPDPDSAKTHVEIPEDALEAVGKLIPKIPDDDDTNHRLALKITGKKLFLCGRSRGSNSLVELEISEATVKGKEVTVWLNRLFLAKALRFGLNQIEIIDELTPLRILNQGRQMIVMPIRGDAPVPTSTRATAPTAQPADGNGVETSSPEPETSTPPQVEERRTMPRTSSAQTNGHGNGDTHQSANAAANGKSTLESAIDQIDTIKSSYRQALSALNDLADTLKQVQREQKSTEKEVQSVRATLEKLHAVKI